jgi:hypothetical protein
MGWYGVDVGGARSQATAWPHIEDAISDAEEKAAVLYETKFDARRAIVRTKKGFFADIPYTSDLTGLDVVGYLDEGGFREV